MESIYTVFIKRYVGNETLFNIKLSFTDIEKANEYILSEMNNDFSRGGILKSIDSNCTLISRVYFPKDNNQWPDECFVEYHCQVNSLIK